MTPHPPHRDFDSAWDSDWDQLRNALEDSQPIPPTAADWARVRRHLQSAWQAHRRAERTRRALVMLGLALCALIPLLFAGPWLKNDPPGNADTLTHMEVTSAPSSEAKPRAIEADPLAGYAVLPVATSSDVMLRVVRGDQEPGIVVVDHPIRGAMTLAKENEVSVRDLGSAEYSQPEPGDSPVILAPGVP